MILRRGGKNTQRNCTKKIFMTQMIMMVWSITPRARHPGMWSQVGLREQSLWTKQVEVKEFQLSYPNPQRWCCESATLNVAVNLENWAWATGLEKVSFNSTVKGGSAKECSNYRAIKHISHASKVMLEILQDRLQQYVNPELPDVQAAFTKGGGTRDQIANISWIIKKAR